MPFEPGKSGNPAGKLKGTRNKTTMAVEALLDGEAETLTRKAIELAKAGELTTPGTRGFPLDIRASRIA
jgi:Family of unknown function (DUF5681)